jgi:hypothetical protein
MWPEMATWFFCLISLRREAIRRILSRSMKHPPGLSRFALSFCVLLFMAGATGCNRQSLSVRNSESFKSAAPELKATWQTAVVAAKTNGYLSAYTNLHSLQTNSSLNAEQSQAVTDLLGVVGTRMFNAANEGDPEATKALKEVQASAKRQ